MSTALGSASDAAVKNETPHFRWLCLRGLLTSSMGEGVGVQPQRSSDGRKLSFAPVRCSLPKHEIKHACLDGTHRPKELKTLLCFTFIKSGLTASHRVRVQDAV